MLLHIQKYDFTVKYVPGKDIPIADGLSRLPIHGDEIPDIDVTIHDITGVSESRLEKIKDETKYDETLHVLRGRSQFSTFMKAYTAYARGRGSGTTVRFSPENQHLILITDMYYKLRHMSRIRAVCTHLKVFHIIIGHLKHFS